MKRRACLLLTTVLAANVVLFGSALPARGEVTHTAVDLGNLPNGTASAASDINNSNQVMGASLVSGQFRPFLWEDGQKTELISSTEDCPGWTVAEMNDFAQAIVTGECWGGLYTPGTNGGPGEVTEFAEPEDLHPDVPEMEILNLNDAGTAVGYADVQLTPGGFSAPHHAMLWNNPSTPIDLHETAQWPDWPDEVSGANESKASDINNDGTVAGTIWINDLYRAATWSSTGQVTLLDDREYVNCDLENYCYQSEGALINDDGDVLAAYEYPQENLVIQGFALWSAGSWTTLPGRPFSVVDMNNEGHVVGHARDDSNNPYPFLWTGDDLVNLNDLIPENSGWVLQGMTGINDSGRIVGHGTHNGNPRAYMLELGGLNPELWDVFALDAAPVTEGSSSSSSASSPTGANPVRSKFVVKRSEVGDTSTIKFTTKDDTAKAGKDYVAKNGTLTFGENAKKKTVYVKILNNNKKEQTEKFFLVLSKPSDNLQITDKKAKATIRDDD